MDQDLSEEDPLPTKAECSKEEMELGKAVY